MIIKLYKPLLSLLFMMISRLLFCQVIDSGIDPMIEWPYQRLNLPSLKSSNQKPFTIAVIDDGFNLNHQSLKSFIYPNSGEIRENLNDDDRNGYLDDYIGWDNSDHDNDPGITSDLTPTYYHGTFIGSVVAEVLKKVYGPSYNQYFRLIPIKVLSDKADNTFIKDGYRGIEYALARNADMIVCAWSGGRLNSKEQELLNRAIQQGVIIVGSAGNMYSRDLAPPASSPGVIAVAALDSSLNKLHSSNYHRSIDFSAPGERVRGAHPIADNAYMYEGETSAATALVAGCLAILKQAFPDSEVNEVVNALKNTSLAVNQYNLSFGGTLGAGIPDVTKAFQFIQDKEYRYKNHNPLLSEGLVYFDKKYSPGSWRLAPPGSYNGFELQLQHLKKKDWSKQLKISTPDSTWMVPYSALIKGIQVPSANIKITIPDKKSRPGKFSLSYHIVPLDSSILYCQQTILVKDSIGTITDGSNHHAYSNNTNCYWKISAPEGYRIEITPEHFDTEAGVDFLWLFDGTKTLPENIIAKYSGAKLPPAVTSRTNETLIWFVTNEKVTGDGWRIRYRIVR